MNVQSVNSINFNAKVKTSHVLELTTLHMFEPDGFMGVVNTMKELYPLTEGLGYVSYAKLIGSKILEKYSLIAEITKSLKEYKSSHPYVTPEQMREKVSALTKSIGEKIEIVI